MEYGTDDGEAIYICQNCIHAAEVDDYWYEYWRDEVSREEFPEI